MHTPLCPLLCISQSMSSSKKQKRNLPSWMSSRDEQEEEDALALGKEPQSAHNFSKLMEGVVFVLSGFVNPDRAQLRSQALEMGAQFQTDWNPNCTLLICAFRNTPKFHQVQADSGTIVSKEWISECYNQRKLVDIEPFLLHAGKPWRSSQDHKAPSALKSRKEAEKSFKSQPSCASSEVKPSNPVGDSFSPSRVKKWAADDLGKTLSWLESQDEKPEQSEIKKIAAEGILTCLRDTIDTLEQGQHIQQISEQWGCIPRVVEELIKLDSAKGDPTPVSKEVLCKHAVGCKQIYEAEYNNIADDSSSTKAEKKKTMSSADKRGKGKTIDGDYDSDETIAMTEEEIEQAYSMVSSSISEFG